MHIDQYTKIVQKCYCRTVLAEHGTLTKELLNKINSGDEETMRAVYHAQQERIRQVAERMNSQEDKEVTLSQVDSIQEILDVLTEILNA